MTLYMAVTADEYELPLAVCELPSTLARKLGRSVESVSSELSRIRRGRNEVNGRFRGYILKEVEVSDDE